MRVILVGGGKIGWYLAEDLQRAGRSVIVVESSPERAQQLAENVDVLVVEGDGTDIPLLEQLEIRSDDLLVAVTGIDEVNLVSCELARTAFKVERVLARLNNPRNRTTFDALEVPVVSVTDLLSQVISRQINLSDTIRQRVESTAEIILIEVEIPSGSPEQQVSEFDLPSGSLLVTVYRDDQVIIPDGGTLLKPGDRIAALVRASDQAEVAKRLTGANGES